MNYDVEVRKIKSAGICRICHKKIKIGTLCVMTSAHDAFTNVNCFMHADCIFEKILNAKIKKVNDEIEDLEEEKISLNAWRSR